MRFVEVEVEDAAGQDASRPNAVRMGSKNHKQKVRVMLWNVNISGHAPSQQRSTGLTNWKADTLASSHKRKLSQRQPPVKCCPQQLRKQLKVGDTIAESIGHHQS